MNKAIIKDRNRLLIKHFSESIISFLVIKMWNFEVKRLSYSDDTIAYSVESKLWFTPELIDELRKICSPKFVKFEIGESKIVFKHMEEIRPL